MLQHNQANQALNLENGSENKGNSAFTHFSRDIADILPTKYIITRYLQRFAYGTDASFYRLIPKIVLIIDNDKQVSQVLKLAQHYHIPVTFRAAGTSLSGQAITDSVLIILSSQWRGITVLEQGNKISLQPGVIGAHANKALVPYARKIGPDPASINSCKIGGIAANNSSGMCCGVKENSYHTLAEIKLIFANGHQLNTGDSFSKTLFLEQNKEFVAELMQLADFVKADQSLVDKIKHKYRLKNTTGYGLNALIDFTDPIDIISHLLIGSEGTLAFISNITYNTVKVLPYKATGLFVFDNMTIACELVLLLANAPVDAVEIMDARALACVQNQLSSMVTLESPLTDSSVGLLIECSANSSEALQANEHMLLTHIQTAKQALQGQKSFTRDTNDIELLWKIRKGMFPAVGSVREVGTTVIIEDVALPLERLAEGVAALQQLFTKYSYHEAIIFGHALDGNLHFVFTQTFDNEKQVARYHNFMTEVTQLVAIDYQGSLKAEHGTGRNMAPFVEMEWGETLYRVMKQLKVLFDPQGILNPGVIINDDDKAHLQHLKTMTAADDIIDTCIECGFCEAVCPSKDFTITPRQRIALWRQKALLTHEIATMAEASASITATNDFTDAKAKRIKQLTELEKDYQFFAIDSCAATGLCGQQCPVGIDTGMFIKSLREKKHTSQSKHPSKHQSKGESNNKTIANNFSAATRVMRLGLNAVATTHKLIGKKRTKQLFKGLNKLSNNTIPLWFEAWPSAAKGLPKTVELNTQQAIATVVYVPACANRMFGSDNNAKDQRSLSDVILSLCGKAGINVIIPKDSNALCCGMPWQSKGLIDIANSKKAEFINRIENASEQGKWPVITDASPCALNFTENRSSSDIEILEATTFIANHVLDKLTITPTEETFMLHTTCSSEKMDQGRYLKQIANRCSNNIIEPNNISCCGFAGDKGFYLPALNESALAPLKAQVPTQCQRGLSNSRTCEIGLSEHSGISYQSVLYLLDQCSESQ